MSLTESTPHLANWSRTQLEELLVPHCEESGRGVGKKIETRFEKEARLRARQIFSWFYTKGAERWSDMTDLPHKTRDWLSQFSTSTLKLVEHQVSKDGTEKFLWGLHDGQTIESVIIPAAENARDESGFFGREHEGSDLKSDSWKRMTACISSQVGCAMGCKFCLTGKQKLQRNLSAAEIVMQVVELRKRADLSNIVFMGMGEPLHNFESVATACEILLDQMGMNFSRRRVTVSTSGLVPKIKELSERVAVNLAVSLNGSSDEEREKTMPVNKRWPIEVLLEACDHYSSPKHQGVTYEYVMLDGVNASLESAKRLVSLLRGKRCKVNLIPFNEHPGSNYKRPSDDQILKFQNILLNNRIPTTVRISRGRDILAACGQLRSESGEAKT